VVVKVVVRVVVRGMDVRVMVCEEWYVKSNG
jgi:hypothetical protein